MKYRALLIDDDTKRIKALVELWTSVFEEAHMDVSITERTDFDSRPDDLLERPHFVIVDNVLKQVQSDGRMNEIENRGVEFIAEHKPYHSDTMFILSTKESFSIDVLGQRFPNPDLIVPKTALSSKAYRHKLGGVIKRRVNRAACVDVVVPDPALNTVVGDFRRELNSIVEQCTYPFRDEGTSLRIKQVNLSKLSGGYSGDHVFHVKCFDTDNRRRVPLALKVSRGTNASREVAAYNAFVRLNLPHDMRVDLISFGEAGEYKGALYAFAFGDASDLCSLADHVSRGDYSQLSCVLEKFFRNDAIGWYHGSLSPFHAEEFYSESSEYDPEKDTRRLASIKQGAVSLLGAENVEVGLQSIRLCDFRFGFIRKQLDKFGTTIVPTCLCHGDFNSHNIMFGRGNMAIATIDFQYSGVDSIYKDFVSLECSLRVDDLRQPVNDVPSFVERVKNEHALLKGRPVKSVAYLALCEQIRKSARECASRSGLVFDMNLYVLALGFHLLKVLGITGLPQEATGQALALFCACGVYLQDV